MTRELYLKYLFGGFEDCGVVQTKRQVLFEHSEDDDTSSGIHDSKVIYFIFLYAQIQNP